MGSHFNSPELLTHYVHVAVPALCPGRSSPCGSLACLSVSPGLPALASGRGTGWALFLECPPARIILRLSLNITPSERNSMTCLNRSTPGLHSPAQVSPVAPHLWYNWKFASWGMRSMIPRHFLHCYRSVSISLPLHHHWPCHCSWYTQAPSLIWPPCPSAWIISSPGLLTVFPQASAQMSLYLCSFPDRLI